MQEYYQIEKRLKFINKMIKKMEFNVIKEYTIENNVLRGYDKDNRILYIRQFLNDRELFQFLCGMEHILEAI